MKKLEKAILKCQSHLGGMNRMTILKYYQP